MKSKSNHRLLQTFLASRLPQKSPELVLCFFFSGLKPPRSLEKQTCRLVQQRTGHGDFPKPVSHCPRARENAKQGTCTEGRRRQHGYRTPTAPGDGASTPLSPPRAGFSPAAHHSRLLHIPQSSLSPFSTAPQHRGPCCPVYFGERRGDLSSTESKKLPAGAPGSKSISAAHPRCSPGLWNNKSGLFSFPPSRTNLAVMKISTASYCLHPACRKQRPRSPLSPSTLRFRAQSPWDWAAAKNPLVWVWETLGAPASCSSIE